MLSRRLFATAGLHRWQEYLLGDTNRVTWKSFTQRDLVNYWYERWVIPRLDALQTNLELYRDQE